MKEAKKSSADYSKSNADLERLPVRCADVIWRDIDGETVLFRPDDKQSNILGIHILNRTAAFAWELSNGELSFEEILSRIVGRFDVQREKAQEDLRILYKNLADKNLVSATSRPQESKDGNKAKE